MTQTRPKSELQAPPSEPISLRRKSEGKSKPCCLYDGAMSCKAEHSSDRTRNRRPFNFLSFYVTPPVEILTIVYGFSSVASTETHLSNI
ncbi:hypothetical protein AVEN_102182-1 [Araneus ventricosus]|uniref:Uncharacterized protein n=1 Tax=Araneus ventricosus TaxID=182803 RepID=A0A4Y2T3C7_ARAVE|nr:hypothetical protein AVEN_102182-1 [Araneus ventricosus]